VSPQRLRSSAGIERQVRWAPPPRCSPGSRSSFCTKPARSRHNCSAPPPSRSSHRPGVRTRGTSDGAADPVDRCRPKRRTGRRNVPPWARHRLRRVPTGRCQVHGPRGTPRHRGTTSRLANRRQRPDPRGSPCRRRRPRRRSKRRLPSGPDKSGARVINSTSVRAAS
jgi:hypothetical protein